MNRDLMKAAAIIVAAAIALTVVQPIRLIVWALVSTADAVGTAGLFVIVIAGLSAATVRATSSRR